MFTSFLKVFGEVHAFGNTISPSMSWRNSHSGLSQDAVENIWNF